MEENNRIEKIFNDITKILDDNKAENLLSFKPESHFYSHVIICSTVSTRHIDALTDHVVKYLKADKIKHVSEGKKSDSWVIVDVLATIAVHIMSNETRERYNLEEIIAGGRVE